MSKVFDEEDLKKYRIIHKKTSDGSKYVEIHNLGTKKTPSKSMVSEPKNPRLK